MKIMTRLMGTVIGVILLAVATMIVTGVRILSGMVRLIMHVFNLLLGLGLIACLINHEHYLIKEIILIFVAEAFASIFVNVGKCIFAWLAAGKE